VRCNEGERKLYEARNQAADDWYFSFRNYNADFYSDSDSDTEPIVRDDPEPRLLNDFDLTSCEETVRYRPNPFSIAKINAASRAIILPLPLWNRP
jgi:hypothetical protein